MLESYGARRAHACGLQQAFIDWNNVKSDTPEFENARKALVDKIDAVSAR